MSEPTLAEQLIRACVEYADSVAPPEPPPIEIFWAWCGGHWRWILVFLVWLVVYVILVNNKYEHPKLVGLNKSISSLVWPVWVAERCLVIIVRSFLPEQTINEKFRIKIKDHVDAYRSGRYKISELDTWFDELESILKDE